MARLTIKTSRKLASPRQFIGSTSTIFKHFLLKLKKNLSFLICFTCVLSLLWYKNGKMLPISTLCSKIFEFKHTNSEHNALNGKLSINGHLVFCGLGKDLSQKIFFTFF